jgi:hypothetical protein
MWDKKKKRKIEKSLCFWLCSGRNFYPVLSGMQTFILWSIKKVGVFHINSTSAQEQIRTVGLELEAELGGNDKVTK